MLDEILLGDGPDPAWMVRYAEDPASLSDAERQAVEAYLASSPRARDELAVLRNFQPELAARPAAPRELARRAPAPRRRWRGALRIAIPIAIAAAAVLAVLWGRVGGPVGRGTEPGGVAPERIAQAPQPPLSEPVAPPEPTRPQPSEPALKVPHSNPPEPAPAEPTHSNPQAPEASPEPPAAPIYVALLEADYSTPWDVEARPRTGNVVRSDGDAPELFALAPEHVARTRSARPTLFWYASKIPAEGEWQLVVTDPEAIDPWVQRALPRPARAGVQRVELERELAPGVEYQWSVLWRPDPRNPASDVVAQGFVRRVDAPAGLRAELAARPEHEHAAIYARAGFWYDALAELERVHRRFPDESGPVSELARMLGQVGLGQLDLTGW